MSGPRITILLVEDETLIALSEKMSLEKHGYRVITAGSGERAIEISALEKDIDIVLMDINLGGGMDGTEAARIILKNRDIPLAFLSSHSEQEVVEKTEKITSYGYIVKNSGITVLDASIKMAFKLFEANKEIMESEERFQLLFDEAPLGYQSLDIDGNFLEVNRQWLNTLGYVREEVIGKRKRVFQPALLFDAGI